MKEIIRNSLLLLLIVSFGASAQSVGDLVKGTFRYQETDVTQARESFRAGRYDEAAARYEACIAHAQANRSPSHGVDGNMVGEYAVVLALQGKHELALLNADRARGLGATWGDWYGQQVLKIAGCDDVAQAFSQPATPTWLIAKEVSELESRYSQVVKLEQVVTRSDLRRFYVLQSSGQTVQALALMDALMKTYPDVAVLHSSYSDLCEQMGNARLAASELNTAVSLMDANDPGRTAANEHLRELQLIQNKASEKLSWLQKQEARFIWYVGGTVAKKSYSLNTRLGLYTKNHSSYSINVGASLIDKKFGGNIGLSYYYTFHKLVLGSGLTYQFSKDSHVVSFSPSIGLTFLNASQTSSFDITLGAHFPFTGGGKTSLFLSLGKTFYFDVNLKKKAK